MAKTSFSRARLIWHVLCSILSALNAGNLSIIRVHFDSLKSGARNTLAILSVTWLQTNRQGIDINCQKQPIRGYTRSWHTGMRFSKQCLQALLISLFLYQTPLVARPLFRLSPLTKSLEQARKYRIIPTSRPWASKDGLYTVYGREKHGRLKVRGSKMSSCFEWWQSEISLECFLMILLRE